MYDNPPYYVSAYSLAVKRGFAGTEEEWLESLRGKQGPEGPMGPQGPQGPKGETPFRVYLIRNADRAWVADEDYDTIWQEYKAGRQVVCRLELDQQWLELPLVKEASGVFTFSTTINRTEWTATITPGEVKCESFQLVRADDLKATATDEIYFDITDDGIISLKAEYRGACSGDYTYGHSDNGVGIAGTRNKELPEEIIIPEAVNGITVTALQEAMFMSNERVKRIVLPQSVSAIPKAFCARAISLEGVSRTENVKTMDGNAFAYTNLRKAYFPNLVTLDGNNHFLGCANLVVADLGSVFAKAGAEIPKQCFSACEKLEFIRNADGVTGILAGGLYMTYRLSNKTFLPNLTGIGNTGLLLSRADYDWPAGSFGTLSNSSHINNYEYPAYTGNGCNTPMRSTFDQHDPRWAEKHIGNTDDTYSSGCMTVCAAMVYSALMGVDMESPEEFVAAVGAKNADLLNLDIDDPSMAFNGLIQWLDAVGLLGKFYPSPSVDNVKTMYSALESGALVIARVLGDYDGTNHIVVFHGINKNGELLVVNPSSAAQEIGVFGAAAYAMPIQNMMRDATGATNTGETIEDSFVIVTKKAT